MANLRRARKRLTTVAIVLAVLDVGAIGFLLSPLGRSRSAREGEYAEARRELQTKMRDAVPLRGMDKKLDLARQQIADFYRERFPAQYSAVSSELGKVAGETGVRVSQISYDPKPAEVPNLQQVVINANLDGDYLQVVKFINALERDKMFFMVDSLTLAQEQGGRVRLQVKLETYLRSEKA
ncbi:MAG TPA: GspMb/PilO family protein [Terriglobales bacterium]|jgi:type IV pilus assembly protein PilO|nr:GspMb/PilO family protein [Terriglobales bacterium]